jgi:hypothetical protein
MAETLETGGPLHAFLAGHGCDGRGRTIEDVLAQSDDALELVHDYIQWLFPLPTRSGAQPDAPVLSAAEIAAIKADPRATANLDRAERRMLAFYNGTDDWLTAYDHNHLRISRIIASLRILRGRDAAEAFYAAIMGRHAGRGAPVNPTSLRYWSAALESQ